MQIILSHQNNVPVCVHICGCHSLLNNAINTYVYMHTHTHTHALSGNSVTKLANTSSKQHNTILYTHTLQWQDNVQFMHSTSAWSVFSYKDIQKVIVNQTSAGDTKDILYLGVIEIIYRTKQQTNTNNKQTKVRLVTQKT